MALTDEVYKKTEGILYRYFRNVTKLERLNAEIAELKTQVDYLQVEVSHGISMRAPSGISRYSDEPFHQDFESAMERGIEKAEDRLEHLEKRLSDNRAKLVQLKLREQDVRLEIVPIKAVLESISSDDVVIIQRRYELPKWYFTDIGERIKRSRSWVQRRHKELIEHFSDALEVEKTLDSDGEGVLERFAAGVRTYL